MLGIGQFGQDQSIELKNYKQSKSILVLGDSDFFDFSIGKKLAKAFPSKKIISGDIEHNIRTYIDYSPAEPNRYKLNYIVLRPRLGLFQKIKSQFKKIVN